MSRKETNTGKENKEALTLGGVVGRSEQLCECKMKTLPDGKIRLTMCKKCVEEEGLA